MGNFCSRERENFDEDLNAEFNQIAKAKPGEKSDFTGDDVKFEDVMKLHEQQKNACGGGGCCSDEAEEEEAGEMEASLSMEEIEQLKKMREYFEAWVKKEIPKRMTYKDEQKTKFTYEFLHFLFAAAVFWMTVRSESYKAGSRVARRTALFGTATPKGPKEEAPDPTPQSIMTYQQIIQQTTGQDMHIVDDCLSAMLANTEVDPENFEKSWTEMANDNEGKLLQQSCFRDYDRIIVPTLDLEVSKAVGKDLTPLTDEVAKELYDLKTKIQLEQVQDIQNTIKMKDTLPPQAQQIVEQQLKIARTLAVPMLADYMWWMSGGKYEWSAWSIRLELYLEEKKKDEIWIKRIEEFENKFREIQGLKPGEEIKKDSDEDYEDVDDDEEAEEDK